MARQHRRQKQDVRLTRVRADIKALSDKVDYLSRRKVLSWAGGVCRSVVVSHLPGGKTQNPRQCQVGQDAHISGGCELQVVNLSMSASAGPPRATFRLSVVPAEPRVGDRLKTRSV